MADNPDFIPLDLPSKSSADFIPLEPTGAEKALQNRPSDTLASGAAKNVATSSIKGLSHIPGFGGDLSDMGTYLFQRAMSAITGTPMEELQRRHEDAEKRKSDFSRQHFGFTIPSAPSGADIARPILERTGEYQPTTPEGRLGAAGVETGLSMIGPGALSHGLKAVDQGANALRIAREMAKGGAKAIPGGAAAGALGDQVTQTTGDPLVGMLASSAAPFAVQGAKAAGRDAVAPIVPAMRPGLADRRLAGAATNPAEAIDAVTRRGTKEGETLGEATLDPGILHTEKAAAQHPGHFQEQMADRDAARSQNRADTIDALAPPADTLAPAKLFRQRLADIETMTQQAVDQATERAKNAAASHASARGAAAPPGDPMAVVRSATNKVSGAETAANEAISSATKTKDLAHGELPPAVPAETTGATLRGVTADTEKAQLKLRKQLYDAVDKDGTLNVVTSDPAEFAQKMKKSINPDVEIPSAIASPVINMVANLKAVTSFADLMKMDRTITAKMAEAAQNGDRIGHEQMVGLKGAVMDAVDNAIENEAKWRQGAVERGHLKPEDTLEASLQAYQRNVDEWLAEKHGRSSSARTGTTGATGPGVVPGGFRAQGKGRREPQGSASPEGVSTELEPNFDAGAAERLGAAKDVHKHIATTYREGTVGQALKTNGFAGQYVTPAAKIPAAAFPKGDIGYHNVRAWLRTNPDATPAVLRDVAVSRLREAMKGGDLTPKALETWKREYGPALRALDEAAPNSGFLSKFETAAKATDALETTEALARDSVKAAHETAAAKFMNLTRPEEVGNALAAMVRSKTGPTQVAETMAHMDEAGRAGAQDALARTLIREHTNAEGVLAADRFRKFVADNRAALDPVFGNDGINRLLSVSHTALSARAAVESVERAIADRKTVLADAQKGTAAKFLKLTDPSEVGDTLMGMVKSRTGPTQLGELWGQMDEAGQAGAKRALTDTILRDHRNADNSPSGAKLKNFITDNAASLEHVYGKDGMNVLSTMAEDAARYQKASGIQRSKTGSDSFANFVRWAKENSGHAAGMSIGAALLLEGAESLRHLDAGQFAAVAGVAAAKHLVSSLRASGARKVSDLVELGMTNPKIGAAMMQRAIDGKGQFREEAMRNLANAIARSAAERGTLDEHARLGRASGGRVGRDPAESARKLRALAEKVKKQHQQQTKPLLRVPDETVAHALKIANRASGGRIG